MALRASAPRTILQIQPKRQTTNRGNLDEKLHGHDYEYAVSRSGDLTNCSRKFISGSEVAKWRGSNRRHDLQPTAT